MTFDRNEEIKVLTDSLAKGLTAQNSGIKPPNSFGGYSQIRKNLQSSKGENQPSEGREFYSKMTHSSVPHSEGVTAGKVIAADF